jgi:hypothetical protein
VGPSARYTLVAGPRPNMARPFPVPVSVHAEFQRQKPGLTPIRRPLLRTTSRLVSSRTATGPAFGLTLTATNLGRPVGASVADFLARRCRCNVLSARPRLWQNSHLCNPLPSNSSTNRLTSSRLRRRRRRWKLGQGSFFNDLAVPGMGRIIFSTDFFN